MKKLTYEIIRDDYSPEFWECEEDLMFFSNHRDYSNQNTKDKLENYEDLQDFIKEYEDKGFTVKPINAYIHGGIALSLSNDSYPFTCQWDSGMFGFLVFKNDTFGENNQGLKGFIQSWASWLNGEVYGYKITDSEGEELDSCWGFIGYENCEEEAKSMLTHCIKHAKLEREKRIKTLIRNRVPLEVRLKELAL